MSAPQIVGLVDELEPEEATDVVVAATVVLVVVVVRTAAFFTSGVELESPQAVRNPSPKRARTGKRRFFMCIRYTLRNWY